ncbi:hypothetical protein Saro_1027 [Novosphingobium aromaticivorans DSM 12444]|uniref:DUF2474 domain-containing protein n=1 Tax=Novosphingobium aromaticivorans (strain ATCC 700278 / DSM 12444 / CCUG 56034 / CIP 105152 / NBRC 16084 / F199) TaxID=279238 RepID=Q2G9K1_NOVAD|nr:DUF2474 domain-containing protein [Novosphingobium aromaticivorans]ABD25472.1 hypothetical protein Saro_1027 [Novosphingobium aromaticivorans DSM 12444]SCX94708.1 Protein of unknown function [Novosphingobium aromaticivorans]
MAIIDPRLDGAEQAQARPLWQRLAWMAAIWLGSVLALGVVAMLIRYWLSSPQS